MAEDRPPPVELPRPAGGGPLESQARATARALFSEHLDLVALRKVARAMKAARMPPDGPVPGERATPPGPPRESAAQPPDDG